MLLLYKNIIVINSHNNNIISFFFLIILELTQFKVEEYFIERRTNILRSRINIKNVKSQFIPILFNFRLKNDT